VRSAPQPVATGVRLQITEYDALLWRLWRARFGQTDIKIRVRELDARPVVDATLVSIDGEWLTIRLPSGGSAGQGDVVFAPRLVNNVVDTLVSPEVRQALADTSPGVFAQNANCTFTDGPAVAPAPFAKRPFGYRTIAVYDRRKANILASGRPAKVPAKFCRVCAHVIVNFFYPERLPLLDP
jgi:hypothetical protein